MIYLLSKKIILPVLAVAVLGTVVTFTSSQVQAQTNTNSFSGLVQAIAQKFGLEQSQVQSVCDDYKNQRKQNMQQIMQQREQDRLNNLVQQGKITDAQEQAILDEQSKFRNEYSPDSFKSLTSDQRKQLLQKKQDEIKAWAQSQGIDPAYVMPSFGIDGFRRDTHKGGWFNQKSTTPSPTPTS